MKRILHSKSTTTKAIFIILPPLISISQLAYTLTNAVTFPNLEEKLTTMSLADRDITTKQNEVVNIVFGTAQGSLLFSNVNSSNITDHKKIFNASIIHTDWTAAGILSAASNQVILHNSQNMEEIFRIAFVQPILFMMSAYRQQQNFVVFALSFSNRIQIYEGKNLVLTFPTVMPCSALMFDSTGKYFYYFDNYARFIVDVVSRTLFKQQFLAYNQSKVAAANKPKYEDITASFGANNVINLWDDYKLLDGYPTSYQKSLILFSDESDYLITVDKSPSNKMSLCRTNFYNYTTWSVAQQFKYSEEIAAVDSGRRMIACVMPNMKQWLVFVRTPDDYTMAIIIIAGMVAIFCGGVFVSKYFNHRKRKQEQKRNQIQNQYINNQTIHQSLHSTNSYIVNETVHQSQHSTNPYGINTEDGYGSDIMDNNDQSKPYQNSYANQPNPVRNDNKAPYGNYQPPKHI